MLRICRLSVPRGFLRGSGRPLSLAPLLAEPTAGLVGEAAAGHFAGPPPKLPFFSLESPLALAGAAGTLLALAYFYTNESEDAIVSRMCGVFESGGPPLWDSEYSDDLDPGCVSRPALQEKLLALLSPSSSQASKRYAVVVGASGTGKSTAVRLAVRGAGGASPQIDAAGNTGAGVKGKDPTLDKDEVKVKGAVYFLAPTGTSSFSTDLMRALRCTEPFSLFSPFRKLVSTDAAKDPSGLQVSLPQPMASWRTLSPMLLAAAARFKSRHGRPAVLVLDAMDLIAKDAPPFFTEVQNFAKECADKGTLRIVFVFSDGRALPLLQSNSARTRAIKPFEVGDISDEDAVAYLKGLGVEVGRSEALVKEVAGGRFSLLQEHAFAEEPFEDTVQQLYGKSAADLWDAGVESTCPLFSALLTQKSIPMAAAKKLMAGDKIFTLLGLNILSVHPNGTYSFHSRHVESFVAKEAAARGGLSPP
jgi:hypothetical protein